MAGVIITSQHVGLRRTGWEVSQTKRTLTLPSQVTRDVEVQACTTTGAVTVSFNGGSSIGTWDDAGFGLGFGYNFDEHWLASFEFQYNELEYKATIVSADKPPRASADLTRTAQISHISGSIAYNLLPGPLTPMSSAILAGRGSTPTSRMGRLRRSAGGILGTATYARPGSLRRTRTYLLTDLESDCAGMSVTVSLCASDTNTTGSISRTRAASRPFRCCDCSSVRVTSVSTACAKGRLARPFL